MDALEKNGVVHRGYLGVGIDEIDNEELAAHLGVTDGHGVIVTEVFDGAPAGKAGLQDGDVVTALGGKPVKDMRTLQSVVAVLPKGKPVEVTMVRDGKPETLSVTIDEQPPDFGTEKVARPRMPDSFKNQVEVDKLGAEAVDLTPKLADGLGYKDEKGALLTDVEHDGAAALAGLGRGVLVTKVEKEAVTGASDLKDKLAKASLDKGVMLQVESPKGGVTYVLVKKDADQ